MAEKSFHLGFDARMYGTQHAGIGRYVENLVQELIADHTVTELTLYVTPEINRQLTVPRWVHKVPVNIRHYTLKEQIIFLSILNKHPVDLMHFPHFNVPLLYHAPFVVTIHDILWHQVRGRQVTTLSPWLYYPKYLGYLLVVRHAIFTSRGIIVPSNFVKQALCHTFNNLSAQKVNVIYEGVQQNFKFKISNFKFDHPYLLYVGSSYPHKNIPLIFQALKILKNQGLNLELKLVSSRSVFLDKLKQAAQASGMGESLHFLGYQTDENLKIIMSGALALVNPSLSEGFGLPGLEAMGAGCPVLSSNATCLPEIYQDAALYFDPHSPNSLAAVILKLHKDPVLRQEIIKKGFTRAVHFRWSDTTAQTISLYQSVLSL